jgi:formylglycine-generating enzyme required for sulfatase activity
MIRPKIEPEEPLEETNSGGKYLKYGLVAAAVAAILFVGTWLVNRQSQVEQAEQVEQLPSAPPSTEYTAQPQTIIVNGVSFKMMPVEGGTFTMGATSEQTLLFEQPEDDEKPTHQVTLSSYMIGETEVTQGLWKAVMGSNPSYFKGDNLPVEDVSWDDCQEFINKLNELTGKTFRLPTEAEWEFAARGGNKSNHTQYAGSSNSGSVAWYGDKTHDVAKKTPNELGLYDMSGNVMEWCQDWYGGYSSSAQTNPQGPSSGSYRVLRGGSWFNIARDCRVSGRYSYYPSDRYSYFGLRLAF